MHTTAELVLLAKQRLALAHGISLPMSDYRFQKLTGLPQSTVSHWTTGRSTIGTKFAAQFSEWTGLPEAYVFACIEHERAKDPSVQRILKAIARTFEHHAAAVVMAIGAATLAAGMNLASPEILAYFSLLAWPDYTLCAIAIMALGLSLPLILARTWPRRALAA